MVGAEVSLGDGEGSFFQGKGAVQITETIKGRRE